MPYRTILKTTIPWTSTIDVSRVTTSKMRCRTILKTTIPWTLTIEKTHYFLDHFDQLLEIYLWYRSRKKWFNSLVLEKKKKWFSKTHLRIAFKVVFFDRKWAKWCLWAPQNVFSKKVIFVLPPKDSTFVHFSIKKITFSRFSLFFIIFGNLHCWAWF